jgi:site-specific recombinase XerD
MAWLERRGKRFRLLFRFNDVRYHVNLKASDMKEADACRVRLEENLRLVERCRLAVPAGADLGLFLISDGKLDQKVEIVRVMKLSEMFAVYQTTYTAGAKEAITRKMEDVHMKHLLRLIGDRQITDVSPAVIQKFVNERSVETHRGVPVKSVTVKKAVATFRFVWNWSFRQRHVPMKYPFVELVFPKTKQSEPFRTFDQIQVIIAREKPTDKNRIRELWDGLFLDPKQVAEVLAIVEQKTRAEWLYPFLITAAYTGARRAELFRARIEDFDFESKLVLLREKKRNSDKETFRTVDMTPLVASVMQNYFKAVHPGGEVAFCSEANATLTDGEAWKAFRTAVSRSKWHVMRGYHAFRHSFASNLAAAGVDSRVICELMGHQTAEMEARYRHLFPDRRRAAVVAVFGNAEI